MGDLLYGRTVFYGSFIPTVKAEACFKFFFAWCTRENTLQRYAFLFLYFRNLGSSRYRGEFHGQRIPDDFVTKTDDRGCLCFDFTFYFLSVAREQYQ